MTAAAPTANQIAEDAMFKLTACMETLQQLQELFLALVALAGEHSKEKRLASLGAYVAGDFANDVDCSIEDLRSRLEAAGGGK